MSDPKAPTTDSSIHKIVQSIAGSLPQYGEVARQQILPTDLAELQSAQTISPQYAELLNQLYAQYAPELAQTGQQVERISREGQAATDVGLLQNYAPRIQAAADAATPELAGVRTQAAGKLGELLGSINLNNANPEAERLVNQENIRSGNINTPSATGTVANAISFGNEMQKRRNALSQAIGAASQFIPAANSGFNAAATLTGRGATGTGSNQFGGITNTSGSGLGLSSQLSGMAGGLRQQENQINADRSQWYDKAADMIAPDNVSI